MRGEFLFAELLVDVLDLERVDLVFVRLERDGLSLLLPATGHLLQPIIERLELRSLKQKTQWRSFGDVDPLWAKALGQE